MDKKAEHGQLSQEQILAYLDELLDNVNVEEKEEEEQWKAKHPDILEHPAIKAALENREKRRRELGMPEKTLPAASIDTAPVVAGPLEPSPEPEKELKGEEKIKELEKQIKETYQDLINRGIVPVFGGLEGEKILEALEKMVGDYKDYKMGGAGAFIKDRLTNMTDVLMEQFMEAKDEEAKREAEQKLEALELQQAIKKDEAKEKARRELKGEEKVRELEEQIQKICQEFINRRVVPVWGEFKGEEIVDIIETTIEEGAAGLAEDRLTNILDTLKKQLAEVDERETADVLSGIAKELEGARSDVPRAEVGSVIPRINLGAEPVAPPAVEARKSEAELKLKAELETARQAFVKAKADKEKYGGLLGRFRGLVSNKTGELVKDAFKKAEGEYQKARESYAEKNIKRFLDERIKLIEEELRQAGEKGWSGKAFDGFVNGWRWLGEKNLYNYEMNRPGESRMKEFAKNHPKIARMISLRMGVSMGLLGAGFWVSPAAGAGLLFLRRVLGSTGATIGTHDIISNIYKASVLQDVNEEKEEKEGKTTTKLLVQTGVIFSKTKQVEEFKDDDLISRIAAFEIEAGRMGKKWEGSKQSQSYKIFLAELEKRLGAVENEGQTEDEKRAMADKLLADKMSEIDKAVKKSKMKNLAVEAVAWGAGAAAGYAVGSGEAGRAIGKVFGKVYSLLSGTSETAGVVPHGAGVHAPEAAPAAAVVEAAPSPEASHWLERLQQFNLSQDEIKALGLPADQSAWPHDAESLKSLVAHVQEATIHRGEGITNALMRQIEAEPHKFGFSGKPEELHQWVAKKSVEYAKKLHAITGVEETRVRAGANVRYLLGLDEHHEPIMTKSAVVHEYHVPKGTIETVGKVPHEHITKVGGVQPAVEHPAGHGAGAVAEEEINLPPRTEAAYEYEAMLKKLSPAEHSAYLAAEKDFDKMVHHQLGLKDGEYYSPRPEVDASGHMFDFDSHSGKITVIFEGDPIDVRLINGKIAGFQDPIDHHWHFLSEEKAIKGAKVLAEKIYGEGYLNWNKSLARVLNEGGLRLKETDWFGDETRETFLGKDYNGILKLENLKEYGSRFLDVHVKDGRLWKIGEKGFLDSQEMISLKSPNFAKRLVEIVRQRRAEEY